MKTILVPIDFSNVTDAVVDAAAHLARATKARLVLLSVVQPPMVTSDYGPMLENLADIVASSEKTVARRLKALAKHLAAPGLPVETVQRTGAPAAIILEQAAATAATMIVMGTHGHTALYDLLVGSTTHQVLRKAPCPVLIVPPPLAKNTSRKRS
jgi:nucleotide-binding universal stress UspA family protein